MSEKIKGTLAEKLFFFDDDNKVVCEKIILHDLNQRRKENGCMDL